MFREPATCICMFREPATCICMFREPDTCICMFREPDTCICMFREPDTCIYMFRESDTCICMFREPATCICMFREPDTCICKTGWKGNNCDECAPYPGCNTNNTKTEGACKKPWECICAEVCFIYFMNIYKFIINYFVLSCKV